MKVTDKIKVPVYPAGTTCLDGFLGNAPLVGEFDVTDVHATESRFGGRGDFDRFGKLSDGRSVEVREGFGDDEWYAILIDEDDDSP